LRVPDPGFRSLALATTLGVVLCLTACGGDRPARAAKPEPAAPARQVRVVAAVSGALPRVVTVTGTLGAEEEAVLGMKVPGRLAQIPADLGSRVSRGQPLARLVSIDFELRVKQAEAALEQARSRLGLGPSEPEGGIDPERTALVREAQAVLNDARARRDRARALGQEQLLSQADLDAAEAGYQVAEARYQDAVEEVHNRRAVLAQRRSELELARQQLADSVLTAPFDGAIRERQASPGQFVAAGQPVVTLVRLHPLRLRLAVPERQAAHVRVGQEVRLTVEGDSEPHPGHVARLSPAIEEGSRTLKVEAEVPNRDHELRPGSFASATILTGTDESVLLVPRTSVVTFAGLERLFVVRDGKAVQTRVRTGRRHEGRVEILEGVDPGASVVVEPGNLADGELVAPGG
jgi:RND family efflux transporter MFP subunit